MCDMEGGIWKLTAVLGGPRKEHTSYYELLTKSFTCHSPVESEDARY